MREHPTEVPAKIGFCLQKDWVVSKSDLVARLAELGYDGVEVWAQAFDHLH